jgi:hypothetical protein
MQRKLIAAVAICAAVFGASSPVAAQAPTAAELLNFIAVAPESNGSSYSRDFFRHWSDEDKDSCNTREEVLLLETLVPITPGRGCKITRGRWFSQFDGRTFTSAASLDIDHFVPLKEAWDSGASLWTASMREAFANDLGFEGSLIAVSAASNRSKSDRDPADWRPTNVSYRCTYAVTWVQIKYRWSLSADAAEVAALQSMLALCPPNENYLLPALAVGVTAVPTPTPTPTQSATPTPTESPSPTQSASPSPTPSPSTSPTASPTPTQSTELPLITPGAFCARSAEGTQGRSATGVIYTCKTSSTDTRLRWRR